MKRLITAGCSFTTFTPSITWPIYLSELFDETYNFGQQGAGNKFIFNSIIEADTKLKLTSDDLVIVEWSAFFRHDMIRREFDGSHTKRFWYTEGDWQWWPVSKPGQDLLLHKCLTEVFSEEEYIHMTHMYMLALVRYLKARKIPYLFMCLHNLRGIGCLHDNKYGELEELYDDNFLIPDGLLHFTQKHQIVLEHILKKPWGGHPSNSIHYKIAEIIAKRLSFSLSLHDDLIELDRITVNESYICTKNYAFDSHPLYTSCVTDISESPFHGIHRKALKYHRGTLPIHKQILKDICS